MSITPDELTAITMDLRPASVAAATRMIDVRQMKQPFKGDANKSAPVVSMILGLSLLLFRLYFLDYQCPGKEVLDFPSGTPNVIPYSSKGSIGIPSFATLIWRRPLV